MKTTITVIKSKNTVLNNKKGDKTKSQHFRFPIHIIAVVGLISKKFTKFVMKNLSGIHDSRSHDN